MIHTVVRSSINLAIDKQGNGLAHKFDTVEARYENGTPVGSGWALKSGPIK